MNRIDYGLSPVLRSPIKDQLVQDLLSSYEEPGGGSPPNATALAIKAMSVSAWTLNEPSGNFEDLIGANDLVASGATTREAGHIEGYSKSTGGLLSVTAAALSPADSSFSFACWLNVTVDGFQGICGSGEGSNCWFLRVGFSQNLNFGLIKSGIDGQFNSASGSIVIGNWHFVVVGYDHDLQKRFMSIDGVPKTLQNHTTGVGASGTAFRIHKGYNIAAIENSIDEAIFLNGVLSDSQISWLYNSGSGRSVSVIANA